MANVSSCDPELKVPINMSIGVYVSMAYLGDCFSYVGGRVCPLFFSDYFEYPGHLICKTVRITCNDDLIMNISSCDEK